jgi:hypothetical protein
MHRWSLQNSSALSNLYTRVESTSGSAGHRALINSRPTHFDAISLAM